ncbi:hypothetical protein Tco_1341973 [Tanacetum coccineum]
MSGLSSQPHTEQPMSPIHAFLIEDMYLPEFLDPFQHTGSFPHTAREEIGAGDEDYYNKALINCEAEHGMQFTFRHCWEYNLNVDDGDDEEDEVKELQRPLGKDKAKHLKKIGLRSSGSSSNMNNETLARLMVSELAMHTKREDRQPQEEIRFYMQPYDHLTGDALAHMEAPRAKINVRCNLPY